MRMRFEGGGVRKGGVGWFVEHVLKKDVGKLMQVESFFRHIFIATSLQNLLPFAVSLRVHPAHYLTEPTLIILHLQAPSAFQ